MTGTIFEVRRDRYGYLFGVVLTEDGQTYRFDQRNLKNGETLNSYHEGDTIEFNIYTTEQGFTYAINVHNLSLIKTKSIPLEEDQVDIEEDENLLKTQSLKWYIKGISKKINLSVLTSEEQTIAKRLSNCLYLSNVGCFTPRQNGIEYRYALFGPTKDFVIQFGLDKVEFAVIFCDKKDFQRRTLEDAFSYLTSTIIPKVRIVGHFYVLFSNYNEIVQELRNPEIQSVLQYSVIPFSYSEILNDKDYTKNIILDRFKEFLFERNFFAYSEPIKDRLFLFGAREQLANSIVDRALSGNHSGIFGIRKSGKTSIINAIKTEFDSRFALYVSYRCSDFFLYEWYEALYLIVTHLYKKMGLEKDIPHPKYDSKTANEYFENDLDLLFSLVDNLPAVLIFDEIELITFTSCPSEIPWKKPLSFYLFWNSIITFCEKHTKKLSLIIAGINPLISEAKTFESNANLWNPMYQKLSNDNYLKMFNEFQVERMVNTLGKYMGIVFENAVCNSLTSDFGGHPFLIRQMCKLICEYINENNLRNNLKETNVYKVSLPLYDEIKREGAFARENIIWCSDILNELKIYYLNEYNILVKIANDDANTLSNIRKNNVELQHLLGYGLVEFDKLSKCIRIKVAIIKNFLINNSDYEKPFDEMSIDDIDMEISGGLSEIERPLRRLIVDVLSSIMTETDAIKFIKSTPKYKSDNKTTNFQNATINNMLDPSYCIIHFNTLTQIICYGDHFEKFKFKFSPYSRADIESYLRNIYVARNSADHHYEVKNETTLKNFRESLKAIKKILKNHNYI